MAHLVLVIDMGDATIGDLNTKIQTPTKPQEAVVNCKNLLQALLAGAANGDVQITVRDTDPSVATSGTGSTQYDYVLK